MCVQQKKNILNNNKLYHKIQMLEKYLSSKAISVCNEKKEQMRTLICIILISLSVILQSEHFSH